MSHELPETRAELARRLVRELGDKSAEARVVAVTRALADAERRGAAKAYEHVYDNLTVAAFYLPLGMELGDRALLIARRIVHDCQEMTYP